jgi:hypothetical protein
MPDGNDKITAFDKAHYEQLIAYLMAVDNVVDTNPKYLGPGADLKLDNTISSRFHPGSTDWSVAKDFLTERRGDLREDERPVDIRRLEVRAGLPRPHRRRRHQDLIRARWPGVESGGWRRGDGRRRFQWWPVDSEYRQLE